MPKLSSSKVTLSQVNMIVSIKGKTKDKFDNNFKEEVEFNPENKFNENELTQVEFNKILKLTPSNWNSSFGYLESSLFSTLAKSFIHIYIICTYMHANLFKSLPTR